MPRGGATNIRGKPARAPEDGGRQGAVEMERLAEAEGEFRRAVQREQATLMAAGLGRLEVRRLFM